MKNNETLKGRLCTVSYGRPDEDDPSRWINDGLTYLTIAVEGRHTLGVGADYVLAYEESLEPTDTAKSIPQTEMENFLAWLDAVFSVAQDDLAGESDTGTFRRKQDKLNEYRATAHTLRAAVSDQR